jgi:hypothetical protein
LEAQIARQEARQEGRIAMSAQTQTPPPSGQPRPAEPPDNGDFTPADALRDAFARFAELKEFVAYYISARVDSIKLSVRNIGIYAALGIMAMFGGAAVVVTAIVLLLVGIAGAFAAVFPNHPWLGDIITAVIFLGVLAGGVIIGVRWLTGSFRNRTINKYESRQSRQRQQFGTNVRAEAERAEGAP